MLYTSGERTHQLLRQGNSDSKRAHKQASGHEREKRVNKTNSSLELGTVVDMTTPIYWSKWRVLWRWRKSVWQTQARAKMFVNLLDNPSTALFSRTDRAIQDYTAHVPFLFSLLITSSLWQGK